MKICHVLWLLDYGGIETMVVNITNEQSRAGNDVTILIINDHVNDAIRGRLDTNIRVVEARRKIGSRMPWGVIRFNLKLRKINADVTHFHGVNMIKYVYKPFLKKWFTTHHTMYVDALKKYFKLNKHLFSISPEVRDDILQHTGIESKVITNGVQCDRFVKRENRKPGKHMKIVQVGRLNFAIKGQDILLEAMKRLYEHGYEVTLDFIGQGPARQAMESMIKSFGLEGCVRVIGPRTQEYLQQHLCDYDLLVQPSRIEGFGLTVAEAMAAKVMVAVSNQPALLGVIDDGECGHKFKSGSAEDCARAISEAYLNYDKEMIERAYDRVKELYDVKSTALKYLEEYK